MSELKPCPFCGKAPIVCEDDSYGGCHVGCTSCDIVPDQCSLKIGKLPEAIAAWNRRPTLTPARPMGNSERAVMDAALRGSMSNVRIITPAADVAGAVGRLTRFFEKHDWRHYEHPATPFKDIAALRSADAPSDEGRGIDHQNLRKSIYRIIPVKGDDERYAVFDVVMGDAIAICPEIEAANKVAAALRSADAQGGVDRASEALEWLSGETSLSLHHYSPTYCDDDDQSAEWRVTKVSGSINDREWDIIGRGETAFAAILDARKSILALLAGGSER